MRKLKYCLFGALCTCLTLGVAVGCRDNDDDDKQTTESKEVMLADFEKWAPDFQTIRLRNEFGSVDVNTDPAYVKSGKQSAALTVVGAEGAEKPLFFVNTVSGRFDYDYSDFSKIDSVSAWLYNASQTDETVYVGLITSIVSIEQVGYEKYETFTLKSGWNEVVYKPDLNYVISAVGQEEYDGIKGVYFMFDNPHAATKAEGKKFFADDIKLNYGEEKPYSEVRAGKYYTSGTQIGAPSYITLKNPVTMKDLEDKALSFEFKFDTDTGKFGFAIMCDDYNWNNITGTLVIEKTAEGVAANMGRIEALEDGWYGWKLNKDMFAGDGAGRAESVSLIYHQGEVVQGNVIINWSSMKAVDAYEVTKEEVASRYVTGDEINGNYNGQPAIFDPIDISEFENKALHFEFKFISETGKFGFVFMDNPGWANITGTLTVEKKADGAYEANMGKIRELENGWYAWELNREFFTGDGVKNAQNVGLIYCQGEKVTGEVMIDWGSVQAVDAYTVTREERANRYVTGDGINGNFSGQPVLFDAIDIAEFEGKALHVEFKFVSATGKFRFAIQANNNPEWKNITGLIEIEKHDDGAVTSNIGRVINAQEDGWYAWELNKDMCAGDGVLDAMNVTIICDGEMTAGEALIDWNSLCAVEPYHVSKEERATRYVANDIINGNFGGQPTLFNPIDIAEFENKALYFEFKFVSETGKFGFVFMDYPGWANITGTFTVEKKADGSYEASMGKIVEKADGWYAWELNSDLFKGDGAAKAKNVGLVNDGGEKVVGEVMIDWKSVQAVDAYELTREELSSKYVAGSEINGNYNGQPTIFEPISLEALNGKALSFEFKFESATGKFAFEFQGDTSDWKSITGKVTVEKTASGITASIGRISDKGNGWYAWKLNSSQFTGSGLSSAVSVDLVSGAGETEGTAYIDWRTLRADDAYELTQEERSFRYKTNDEINGNFNGQPALFDPIAMSALENKALHFEFKFISETGKFGFVFMDNPGWANITGTLTVEKKADGVYEANMGKIRELENGWYAWELNREFFTGDGVKNAQNVGLIYCQGEKVTGEVMIDWGSVQAVDAYTVTREERAEQFTDGNTIEHNFQDSKIPMTELQNKALSFEFKFASETGKFGFNFEDANGTWKSITGDLIIRKTSKGVSANMGVVTAMADGWYQWKLNRNLFAGHNVADAESVNLAYHYDIEVEGTVYIDWNSFKAVDAYSVENEKLDDSYFDGFEGKGDSCVLRVKDWTETELSDAEKRNGAQSFKIYVKKNNSSVVLKLDTDMIAAMINPLQLTLWVNVASGTCGNLICSVYNQPDGDYLGSRATVEAGENGTWRKITFSAEQVQEIKTIGAITLYFDFGSNGSGVAYVDDLELTVTDSDVKMDFEDKTDRYESGAKVELADFANTEKFAGVEFDKLTITCNGEVVTCSLENNKMFFAPDEAGRYVFEYTHVNGHKIAKATQVVTVYEPLADPYVEDFESGGRTYVEKNNCNPTATVESGAGVNGSKALKIQLAQTDNTPRPLLVLDDDMKAKLENAVKFSLQVRVERGNLPAEATFNLRFGNYKAGESDNQFNGYASGGSADNITLGAWYEVTYEGESLTKLKDTGVLWMWIEAFGNEGRNDFVFYLDDLTVISPDPDFTISAEDKDNIPVAVGESIEIASFTGEFVPEKLSVTLNGNPYSDYTLDGNKLSFVPMGAGEYNFVYTYTNGYFLNTATQRITVIAAPLADPKFDGFEGTGNASVIKTLNGATTELSKEEKHSGNQSLKVSVTAGYDSIVIGLDTDMIAAMTGSSQLSLWVYVAGGSCAGVTCTAYNADGGWFLNHDCKVSLGAVGNDTWHEITFTTAQTATIKSIGSITLCFEKNGDSGLVAYVDDIEITERKTIVMDFETGGEEMVARSYADSRISTVEISEEQANSGTKSIKVFQNQHGALVLKLSQEMIDAIDDSSTLTVRYMITDSDKNQTTACMNFFAAKEPNGDTDKQDPGYYDCKMGDGVDSGPVAIDSVWKSKEISGELLASIKANGYLWMQVSVTEWSTYTFYVDNITLE